jgi:hypothetical protein
MTNYTPSEIRKTLSSCIGTANYYKTWPFGQVYYLTDGAKMMADMCQAHWLIFLILSYQRKIRGEEFQVWRLGKVIDHSATVTCTDGNNKELARQVIYYTDFPLSEGICLWLEGNVIYLPSEH